MPSPFMIQTLSEVGTQLPQPNKGICEKPTADIQPIGEELKAASLTSGTRPGCPLSPRPFTVVLALQAVELGRKKKPKAFKLERRK